MKNLVWILVLFASLLLESAAYADTPSASFDVNNIHVDKYGNGETSLPALILIPGLTNGAAVWAATIHHFALSYTVYALTLPGFAGRAPVAAPLLETVDADIVALMGREHLNKPILIGHSMGGSLAIRLATEHSDIVRGVIAVDGLPVFPGFDTMTPEQRASAASKMSAQMRSAATPEEFTNFIRSNVVPYMTVAKNVDVVAQLSAGTNPNAAAEYMQELLSADLRPQLSKITVPLLELAPYDATLDKNPPLSFATPSAKQAYYEGLLKNDKTATVQIVQDSRHFIMYDQPDAFYVHVQTFLDLHK